MQHRTMDRFRAAGDSGESNRPYSPRPGNNSEPLYRPIQRSGSGQSLFQLVSGSGKGQNLGQSLYVCEGTAVLIKT